MLALKLTLVALILTLVALILTMEAVLLIMHYGIFGTPVCCFATT